MRPLFFSLFVFFSFTVTAQLPKPGHDGYRKYFPERPIERVEVVNNRNVFNEWYEGRDISMWWAENSIDSQGIIKYIFQDHKCFYNGRYYYTNYKENGKYCYEIFLYELYTCLSVESRYNDSEYIECKHMLDKEARTVLRKGSYNYDESYD